LKKLKRGLTITSVVAISIGGMLGSGLFVLPGLAAAKTGPSVWLAYLLAAICILPAALSKSELASAIPSSGGTYVYIERVFGPILGTISGIGLWFSLLLKSAFALVGFGAYMLVLINIPDQYTKLVAIAFLLLIMFLNILGVKKVGKVQVAIVSISFVGLLLLLFSTIPEIKTALLTPFTNNGSKGFFTAVAFVYISYAGVIKVAAIAGEVKNPSKNIPLGMILSLGIITLIYVSVTYVLVGNVPIDELKNDITPIFTLADNIVSSTFGYIIACIGAITLISGANSGLLATSRFPFAMALDQLLPKQLAKVHKKHLTPVTSILLTAFIMIMVILFLDVEGIAKLASAFMVMMFVLVNICVIILRETAVQWYEPKYLSPFYPLMQIFGVISGIFLLSFLGWKPIIAMLIISVIGILIYYFFGKETERIGVLKKYGHKPALMFFFNKEASSNEQSELSQQDEKEALQINISQEAGVIIPLLGNEKSPEMLIEMGAAINTKQKVQAVNITEVPDQTLLEAISDDNPKLKAIERQVKVLANTDKIDIAFESVVTHNIANTIQALSRQSNCEWLIFGWNGRAYNGILFNNPLGWILTNINSNFALFKDNGLMLIKKVLLAIRPSSQDIKEIIETTDKICQFYNASFTLLHVVSDELTDDEMEKIRRNAESLIASMNTKIEVMLVKSNEPLEKVADISANFDLLVLGTPRKDSFLSILFGTGQDKIATNSNCSVLRLTLKPEEN
jgi:APA family basic amino acid/polyamine antiporter